MAGMGEAYWKLYVETKDPQWAEQAEEAALSASELDPDLAGVHISLGTIYRGTGQSESAAAEFRRALEIDSRSTTAHRGLAWALVDTGNPEAAEVAFLDAIRIQPADWAGHSHLGTFYFRQGRFPEGLEAFKKVVELTPDNARGFRNLAGLHQSLDQPEEAITAYERSLQLQPDYRTYSNLATLYRSQGRMAEAIAAYRTAIELNDQNCLVWGALAGTYELMRGQAAEVERAYRSAIAAAEAQLAVNPHDAQLLAILAQFHGGIDERERALELVNRALDLAPDQPDILFYVSATFEVLGERAAALDATKKALAAGYPISSWYQDPTLVELVADPAFKQMAPD